MSDADDLFHRAPCGLLSTTPDGTVTAVNDTFLHWTGYERDTVVDSYFMDRLTPGSKLFYETRFMPMLQTHGHVKEMALELVRADGSKLPIFVNSTVDDADGNRHIRTAVFDATTRHDYERHLLEARRTAEASVARVRILEQAATGFSLASTEAELSQALVQAAQQATDAAQVGVMLVQDATHLEVVAGKHPLGDRMPLSDRSPETEAARLGTSVTCGSPAEITEQFPESAAALRSARVEALIVVPIIQDGSASGVLYCAFGRPRNLDERIPNLLTALTSQAAPVLHRIRLQRQIEHNALHDSLTGLPNRTMLRRTLERSIVASQRHTRSLAVVFLDLDGFKAINDTLGHSAGDSTLRQVSARLAAAARRDEVVGRLGGDEFLLVCDEVDPNSVQQLAGRLRDTIEQPLDDIPSTLPLSASIGICVFQPSAANVEVTADLLIQLADTAMYESKRLGKARTTVVSA
ncbi:MAG: diguanylate cyclase [Microbacteriaceae bacterium]